jgi:hypothetical protein
VIITTVLIQSFSAKAVTRALGLAEAEPNGMLILGANPVARAIGIALRDQGFRVKLADTSYEEIRAARMAGLEVYYGDPVSSHAEQFLELVGIGRLFAMSRRSRWNTLACMKYKGSFGANRVFSLRNSEDNDESDRSRLPDEYVVPRLFGSDVSYKKLASLLSKNAKIKTLRLSPDFDLEQYKRENRARLIPLFTLEGDGKLRVVNDDIPKVEADGVRLMALVWPQEESSPENSPAATQAKKSAG